jgi:hypothetical protein
MIYVIPGLEIIWHPACYAGIFYFPTLARGEGNLKIKNIPLVPLFSRGDAL